MLTWIKRLFAREAGEPGERRAVPGSVAYRDSDGRVLYNMLDPAMQQFLGRCVGSIKKSGVRAKGTGQFSVLLGEDQAKELILDEFWQAYARSGSDEVFEQVVAAAQSMAGGAE